MLHFNPNSNSDCDSNSNSRHKEEIAKLVEEREKARSDQATERRGLDGREEQKRAQMEELMNAKREFGVVLLRKAVASWLSTCQRGAFFYFKENVKRDQIELLKLEISGVEERKKTAAFEAGERQKRLAFSREP